MDLTGQPLDGVARFRCGVLHVQAQALRPLLQHLAGGRQANAAAGALEQRPAADFFQAPKAAREGRLAPVQPQRRLADMLQLGDDASPAPLVATRNKEWLARLPTALRGIRLRSSARPIAFRLCPDARATRERPTPRKAHARGWSR